MNIFKIFIGNSKSNSNFSSLSIQEKKKIVKRAARKSNEDQRFLVEECNKKFGQAKVESDC
jgi:hypothetical protein